MSRFYLNGARCRTGRALALTPGYAPPATVERWTGTTKPFGLFSFVLVLGFSGVGGGRLRGDLGRGGLAGDHLRDERACGDAAGQRAERGEPAGERGADLVLARAGRGQGQRQ